VVRIEASLMSMPAPRDGAFASKLWIAEISYRIRIIWERVHAFISGVIRMLGIAPARPRFAACDQPESEICSRFMGKGFFS
jgi:hypothetical protein